MSDASANLSVDALTPPDGPPGPALDRTHRGWLVTAAVAVVYLGLSVLANGSVWAHGVTHSVQPSGGNDFAEEVWFLAQTPWVFLHGHNPFANDWLNAPMGVNLMDNTTMPLLGIVAAPITLLLGPIATFNILIDLAIFASALSFFVMARRFVHWWPAAFVGGLLYGFSPFTAATANAHLFLLFQAVPPLLIYFVDRFLRPGDASPRWSGIAIGLCFVAQFYVSTEVFASLVVMTACALVLGGAYVLWQHLVLDWRRLLIMAGCAALVLLLGVGYAAWVAIAGPEHITGPAQPASVLAGVSIDPVGLVVPTVNQHFTLGHEALGDSLVALRDPQWKIVADSPVENGSYIGVPLLLALVVGAVALRRKRFALFCSIMAAIGLVMSLGPRLHVDGRRTGIPLPFDVITHVPLLNSSVSARWITYFWLFAALLLALVLDAVYRVAAQGRFGRRGGWAWSGALAVVVLLPLLPAWPYASAPADVPTWFTAGARSLPAGSAALVYPLASSTNDQSMLWQAMADMQFRMPGGFAVIPGPDGANTFGGEVTPLSQALAECEQGAPAVTNFTAANLQAQLRRWGTKTVAIVPSAPGAACATTFFTDALGPPEHVGGVLVWPEVAPTP